MRGRSGGMLVCGVKGIGGLRLRLRLRLSCACRSWEVYVFVLVDV